MNQPNTINFPVLNARMKENGLDALVASAGENIYYLSRVPIPSVLGVEPIAQVVIYLESDPTLLISNIDESLAHAATWIKDIRTYEQYKQSPMQLLVQTIHERGLENKSIGVEKKFLTTHQYEELISALPSVSFMACDDILERARVLKTDDEVRILAKGASIAEEAIQRGFSWIQPGVKEKGVLDYLNDQAASLGGEPSGSIFASGSNSAYAHNEAGPRQLQKGDIFRVDFCGFYNGYWYDLGRTGVVGKPSLKQRDAYRRLWTIQRKVIAYMLPGVRACDVYQYSCDAYREEGLVPSFPHLGHSLGISIHENPLIQPNDATVLEPNMLFCVEPFYLEPGVCGYHVEDLVQVKENGCKILSDLYNDSELFVAGE